MAGMVRKNCGLRVTLAKVRRRVGRAARRVLRCPLFPDFLQPAG